MPFNPQNPYDTPDITTDDDARTIASISSLSTACTQPVPQKQPSVEEAETRAYIQRTTSPGMSEKCHGLAGRIDKDGMRMVKRLSKHEFEKLPYPFSVTK